MLSDSILSISYRVVAIQIPTGRATTEQMQKRLWGISFGGRGIAEYRWQKRT